MTECPECRGSGKIRTRYIPAAGAWLDIPCYACQPHKRCVLCRRVYHLDKRMCECGGPLIERQPGER